MPSYDYECVRCGEVFEREERISDERMKTCPHCGGKVETVLQPALVLNFKGKDWTPKYHKRSH